MVVSFNQIFSENYNDVVKKIDVRPKLSFLNKLKRLYNQLFKKHILITDFEFCQFSKLAYSNDGILQAFVSDVLDQKYEIVDFITCEDGLQFYVIKAKLTKDLIIAFRGTDEWVDWLTNIQILNKGRQFETAKEHLNKIIAENLDHQVYFCGHSLGGALAQEMTLYYYNFTKVKLKCAVTFNSAGVRLKQDIPYANLPIKNYIVEQDLVGCTTGYHYGKIYFLKAGTQKNNLIKLYTHSLDQFNFDEQGNLSNQQLFEIENKVG